MHDAPSVFGVRDVGARYNLTALVSDEAVIGACAHRAIREHRAELGAATLAPLLAPNPPTVLSLTIVSAERAAVIIRALYPRTVVRVDRRSNAVIFVGTPDEVAGIRAVITGVDVKDSMSANIEALQLHMATPNAVVARMRGVFPQARFAAAANRRIVIAAPELDLPHIKAVIAVIDPPPVAPTAKLIYPAQTIRVLQADARAVARAVAHAIDALRVAVSGSDSSSTAAPMMSRKRTGSSQRSIIATAAMQNRIGDAIAQLDVAPTAPGTTTGNALGGRYRAERVAGYRVFSAIVRSRSASGAESTAKVSAYTVTSCPAAGIVTAVSRAIAGTIPDTISSPKPSANGTTASAASDVRFTPQGGFGRSGARFPPRRWFRIATRVRTYANARAR